MIFIVIGVIIFAIAQANRVVDTRFIKYLENELGMTENYQILSVKERYSNKSDFMIA